MNWTTVIGLSAATLTTVAYLPQVLKSWRTRKTNNISFRMYAVMTTGVSLWLIYGFILRDLPLVLANTFTLILVSSVLYLKIKHG